MLCPVDTKYPLTLPQFNAFGLKILLAKESIAPLDPVKDSLCFLIFAVSGIRSPGRFRAILNLLRFNKSVGKITLGWGSQASTGLDSEGCLVL